jgi:hypothetical protein
MKNKHDDSSQKPEYRGTNIRSALTRFWNNLHQVLHSKSTDWKVKYSSFGSNKTKGPKQNSQHRIVTYG